MYGKHLALFSIIAALGSCAEDIEIDSNESEVSQAPSLISGLAEDRLPATKVVMSAKYEQDLIESGSLEERKLYSAGGAPTVIYLNRHGGSFVPGQNNASTNRSTIIVKQSYIPPATYSAWQWNQIKTCISGQFSRFNVEITDVNPGNTPHLETVFGGRSTHLGFPEDYAGVSPFTSHCDVIPNSIVYVFSEALPNDPQYICEVAAQEIAHSFGLDHQFLCSDPMTYLDGCGAKHFQDRYSKCGEYSERPSCSIPGQFNCGYSQQNSVKLLTQRLGVKTSPTPPESNPPIPETTIDTSSSNTEINAPINGSIVEAGFKVRVGGEPDVVRLYFAGKLQGKLSRSPFVFNTSPRVRPGNYRIDIIAIKNGQTIRDHVNVTVISPTNTWNPAKVSEESTQQAGCSITNSPTSSSILWILTILWFVRCKRKNLFQQFLR